MKNFLALTLLIIMAMPSLAAAPAPPAPLQTETEHPTIGAGNNLANMASPNTVVVIQPPSEAPWYERYQTAWSTVVSAAFGFGGIIWATIAGFRHSRKNLKTQADQDRAAREEHWEAERRLLHAQWQWDIEKAERTINEERKKLAGALAAELTNAQSTIKIFCDAYAKYADKIEKETTEFKSGYKVKWFLPCTIYSNNITHIGLLNTELVSALVSIYAYIKTDKEETNSNSILAADYIRHNIEMGNGYIKIINYRIKELNEICKNDKEPELPL